MNGAVVEDAGGADGGPVLVRLHLLQQPVQGRRPEVHGADRPHQAPRQQVAIAYGLSYLSSHCIDIYCVHIHDMVKVIFLVLYCLNLYFYISIDYIS